MKKRCKCKMPVWVTENLTHCARCKGLLPDIRICECCHKEFRIDNPQQEYCSEECWKKANGVNK